MRTVQCRTRTCCVRECDRRRKIFIPWGFCCKIILLHFNATRMFTASCSAFYSSFFEPCFHRRAQKLSNLLSFQRKLECDFNSSLSRQATNVFPWHWGENSFLNLATRYRYKCQRQQSFVSVYQGTTTHVRSYCHKISRNVLAVRCSFRCLTAGELNAGRQDGIHNNRICVNHIGILSGVELIMESA